MLKSYLFISGGVARSTKYLVPAKFAYKLPITWNRTLDLQSRNFSTTKPNGEQTSTKSPQGGIGIASLEELISKGKPLLILSCDFDGLTEAARIFDDAMKKSNSKKERDKKEYISVSKPIHFENKPTRIIHIHYGYYPRSSK